MLVCGCPKNRDCDVQSKREGGTPPGSRRCLAIFPGVCDTLAILLDPIRGPALWRAIRFGDLARGL